VQAALALLVLYTVLVNAWGLFSPRSSPPLRVLIGLFCAMFWTAALVRCRRMTREDGIIFGATVIALMGLCWVLLAAMDPRFGLAVRIVGGAGGALWIGAGIPVLLAHGIRKPNPA
jgi:hypothetical protein